MGMCYQYAGSASYPRFESELRQIAKTLGCQETKHITELEDISKRKPFGYWFGIFANDDGESPKFNVPDTLPEAVAKWINNPYDARTPNDTMQIWNTVSLHPEIQDFAGQIWSELQQLAECHAGWNIT